MKILIAVDSININDSSGSKANVALITNLAKAGFEVKVYHYTQKNIQLPGVACVSIPEKKRNVMFVLSRMQRIFTRKTGIHVHRFLENLFGFSFTFFNDTNSIVNALKKEVSFEPDLVLTLSKAASFRPHYALLKLPKWHQKWMAYVHDPYPFHYYPRPYNWVEPGYEKKELFFRKVSEKAAYSAFPSQLLKEWMGSYFSNFLKTGIVIPHQSIKLDNPNFFPEYFDSAKFSLMHAGNLMAERPPIGLIEGFKLFLEKNIEAKQQTQLLLIGSSDFEELLKNFQKSTEQLTVINKSLSFQDAYFLQTQVSVNIILESKSEISPFLPGKFPHCVTANKPILLLCPYYSESKRLLGADYPYWAEIDDRELICSIIEKMYKQWLLDSDNFKLNRDDLTHYISEKHLKEIIDNL